MKNQKTDVRNPRLIHQESVTTIRSLLHAGCTHMTSLNPWHLPFLDGLPSFPMFRVVLHMGASNSVPSRSCCVLFFFLMICRSQGEEKSGELKGFEYKGVIPSLSFFPIRTHCYPLALSESVLHTAHTFPHPTLCLWGRRRLLGIRDSPFSLGEERSGCWKCTLRQHCGGGLNSRGIKRAQ